MRRERPDSLSERSEEKMGHRASPINELIFEDCVIPDNCLLGKEGEGFKIAMVELNGGRIGIGSLAVGVGFAAIDFATDMLKKGQAFGKPLSSFEAIQWMIADSYTELEAAQLLVLRAAYLKEKSPALYERSFHGKAFCHRDSKKCGDPCSSNVGRVWLYERLSSGTLPSGILSGQPSMKVLLRYSEL